MRAIDHPDTRAAGIAGRLGEPVDDLALAVDFGSELDTVWVVPELVVFVDHDGGATAALGDARFVKSSDGTWRPLERRRGSPGFVAWLRRMFRRP